MKNISFKATLVTGYVISAILIAISAGLTGNPEATAQSANATATANQTTTANQTGPSIGNLTSADFSATWDSLEQARSAIIDNDTYAAFFAMNDADSNLYGAVGETALQQQITPVRDQLNNAQDAVINQDLPQALEGVNSASVELTKITQQLPQGE